MARPRNADAAATRDRILEAARTVAIRDGIRAVTCEAVAKEAGVAKSTAGSIHKLIEHLIDFVFAALIVSHTQTKPPSQINRWMSHDISSSLIARETGLARLAIGICALAATHGTTGDARRYRDYFLRYRDAATLALIEFACEQGKMARDTATEYAGEVISDFFDIAIAALDIRRVP